MEMAKNAIKDKNLKILWWWFNQIKTFFISNDVGKFRVSNLMLFAMHLVQQNVGFIQIKVI